MKSDLQHYRTTNIKMAMWLIEKGCKLARLKLIKENSRQAVLEYAIQGDKRKLDLASLIREYHGKMSRIRFRELPSLSLKEKDNHRIKFLLKHKSDDFKSDF